MGHKLVTLVLALTVIVSLVFAGCAKPAPAPAPSLKPIKIGALLSMTGPFAQYGPHFRDGIELALDEEGWKIAGRPIQLIIEDDKSFDTAVGLDKTRKMVESDKIDIMIGPLHSGVRLGMEPYIEEKKIPNIALSRHLEEAAKVGGWVFLQAGTLQKFSRPMGWGAYEYSGFRTANSIASDFVAGHKYIAGAIDGFKEKGGKVVLEQLAPLGTEDFAPYVLALKDADVVMTWLTGLDTHSFLTAFFDLGYEKRMKVIIVISEENFEEVNMPPYGDKIIGITGSADYTWRIDTPINKKFVEATEEKTGGKPIPHTSRGYDAARTAIEALKVTGGDTTPEKVRQAILGLKLDLPCGPLSFTPDGIGIRNIYIVEIRKIDGKYGWEIVKTYPEFSIRT